MTKPKTPRHSNRRSGKLPGKRKTPATTGNTPAGKAEGAGESILRVAHIPDESLCMHDQASAAGGLLVSLRAHNVSAGGLRPRGCLCEPPGRFPAQSIRARLSARLKPCGSRSTWNKPGCDTNIDTLSPTRGAGTRIQVLTHQQYCLFRLLCIFRHIACRVALSSDEGRLHAMERSKARLDADAASLMEAPHQKRRNEPSAPGRGGASKFRAQFDELSPGLLRSPLSR